MEEIVLIIRAPKKDGGELIDLRFAATKQYSSDYQASTPCVVNLNEEFRAAQQ